MNKQSIRESLPKASVKEINSGKFVPVTDAARRLHVTPATVLNRIKRGNYPGRTFQGRLVLVDISEMLETTRVS